MIDAVSRDGYVIAQEYLPAAARGDLRLFMMNGELLKRNSKYAAFARRRPGGDMRSNIHAGGKVAKAQPTEAALRIAELIRPKLVMDGMFLVGLDIVGDKLMEVNVFSPGGLGSVHQTEKVDFSPHVIEAIERKVQYATHYRRSSDHAIIAML
jgi:glutathione synthase